MGGFFTLFNVKFKYCHELGLLIFHMLKKKYWILNDGHALVKNKPILPFDLLSRFSLKLKHQYAP